MPLSGIQGHRLRIPFSTQVSHSLFKRTESEALIVVVEDSSGVKGYGEGTPRNYVTGETIEGCTEAFNHLAAALLDQGAGRTEDLMGLVGAIGASEMARRNPSCWCAVETAVLDLCGQKEGKPVWQLFTPEPVLRDFHYSAVFPLTPDSQSLVKMATLANRLRIRFVKAKVADGKWGVETLRVLRSELGPQVDIRVDANGAFSAREALTFLDEAEPFGISAFEQPVPKTDLAALGAVTQHSRIPVFADESLCSLEDAERLIQNHLCTGFNIRLSKCGGFLNSLAIWRLAQAHDMVCQLGCHVGETAILSAAGRHMAALCGKWAYLEGSYSRYLLEEDLSTEDISFGSFGYAPLLLGPGLGIMINDSRLAKWGAPVGSSIEASG